MSVQSIGDQSRVFVNRNVSTRLKAEMQRLTQELSTGRLSRPGAQHSGDTAHLLGIERSLAALGAYRTATGEAQLFTGVAQQALGVVADTAADLGPALLTAASSLHSALLDSTATEAAVRLGTVISALNTRAGDRAVFAGTATATAPLADAQVILDDLAVATAGLTTAADIAAAVDDWFNLPGGGFDTVAYLGSASGGVSFRIGEAEDVAMPITAASPEIRALLHGFALGALVGAPGLAGSPDEQAALAGIAGEAMVTAGTAFTETRAAIGALESRLETMTARHQAGKTALEVAYNRLTAADPYDTATAFEEASIQLETLYALTARLSGLTLTSFLR